MNEKVQDFRGLSALLIGNKAECTGIHLQLTSAFSLGTPIPHWVYGPQKYPARRTKKQSVRIKPLRTHRPYGMWNRNLGAGTVSETRRKQHRETQFGQQPLPMKCLLPR